MNAVFNVTGQIDTTPLTLALCEQKTQVIHWLLNKNAAVNDEAHPALLMAASNCKPAIVQLLIDKEANVNAPDQVGKTPLSAALYGNQYNNIPVLLANGYQLKEDGRSLRQAVSSRQYPAVKMLLDAGVDVNLHLPDMVFPYNPTAVCVAAQNNDLDTVKFNRIVDIKEVNWQGHTFLDLLSDVDNYSPEGLLVWYPKKKCLACADYEHGELKELSSVADFLQNPGEQLNKIFE